GTGLPLIRLEQYLPVSPLARDLEEMYVIVPKSDKPQAGILASRILDTMETAVAVHDREHPLRGLLGSSFLEGRMTLFLDMPGLLSLFERRTDPGMKTTLQGRSI
ncbi:MAG: hypothetical protein K9M82_12245, partial [Deltaproteobacteria bacterium]|nr:hypothetical protein [Deltaproteobacteria bacterium]